MKKIVAILLTLTLLTLTLLTAAFYGGVGYTLRHIHPDKPCLVEFCGELYEYR